MKKPNAPKLRARTLDFAQLDVHGGGGRGIGYGYGLCPACGYHSWTITGNNAYCPKDGWFSLAWI